MKYLCFILLVSVVYSAPVNVDGKTSTLTHSSHDATDVVKKATTKSPEIVEIVESGSDHKTDGSYSFNYRGADGSFREETAVVKNPGAKNQYLEITGAYSYFDVDGKEVVVQYKADNHGFVPVGNSIPDAISVAARDNSQLSPTDEDDEDDEEVPLQMPQNSKTMK